MDYKIKIVKDNAGNNMALGVMDVTDGEAFTPHLVPNGNKNLAVPTILTGKLLESGEIILPDANLANYCVGTTSTAAGTANKVINGISTDYVPKIGDFLTIAFLVANSAASITFSINNITYPVKFNGANTNTLTAAYAINTQVLYAFDGTNFNQLGSYRNTDSNDTAQYIHQNNLQFAVGVNAIYKYKIVAEGADGKLYPLTLEDSTAATKTVQTQPLKFNGRLFYWNNSGTIAASGSTASAALQLQTLTNDTNMFNYAFNGYANITEKSNIYLVGTINADGNFVLDNTSATSWYTNAIPEAANGKVYRLIGYRGTGNYVSIGIAHGLQYYYYADKVREYIHFINAKLDGIAAGANNYTHPTTAGNKHVPSGGSSGQILKWSAAGTAAWGTISASDTGGIPNTEKGANGGVATLGTDGKVPSTQLPSYVDDVLEYTNLAGFPTAGETGKIYVAKDTNKTYRWSGSAYVIISETLALGETSSTAYAGDKGKGLADALGTLSSLTTSVKTNIVNAINSLVTALGTKVDKITGKDLSTNDFTDALKTKLDGIAAGANNYTHPTTAGNKHVPSGGSSGQILKWSADGTAAWATNDTGAASGSVVAGTYSIYPLDIQFIHPSGSLAKYIYQTEVLTSHKMLVNGTVRCTFRGTGLQINSDNTTIKLYKNEEPLAAAYNTSDRSLDVSVVKGDVIECRTTADRNNIAFLRLTATLDSIKNIPRIAWPATPFWALGITDDYGDTSSGGD